MNFKRSRSKFCSFLTGFKLFFLLVFSLNGVVLSADEEVTSESTDFHSWVVETPMFEQLLSQEPAGLRSQGGLIWQHLIDVPVGRDTAVRWGVRYVSEEMYRLHGQLGFKIIASGPNRTDDPQLARKYQVLSVPEGLRPTAWSGGGQIHILHPDAVKAYLASIEAFLEHADADIMWGIFAGDEDDDVAIYRAAQLIREPGSHTYIHELNRQVRDQFGGGRWGIPAGIKNLDPNPYKWIALYRYVASRLRDRQRTLYRLVKKKNPDLIVIPVDSPGGIYPTEWSELAPYGDLFTQQMGYPGGSHRWRATIGFHCKVVSDITGKDFWPCAHFEHYDYPHSRPEEVLEEISQIFRNGGTGIHIYLPDTLNLGKSSGDLRTTYFSSPRRYHTVMNIARFIRTMPKLKLPSYERTAILHNDDTLASRPNDGPDIYGPATQACYTLLGPVATAWFKFIDSAQVAKWPTLRDRFDVIYLPAAKYQRQEITTKLQTFVRNGGTLICGDPEAFQTDLVGKDTSQLRQAIFGVAIEAKSSSSKMILQQGDWKGELSLSGPTFQMTPTTDLDIWATFEDGSPAITARKLGSGQAVMFGSNPFHPDHIADELWRNFFPAFVKETGTPTNFDIWNFQLPTNLIWHEPLQEGICLTNNHVLWQEEQPSFPQNVDSQGTYRFSLAPTTPPHMSNAGDISFALGRLTDRRKSIHAEKNSPRPYIGYKLPANHWMVRWENPHPLTIMFDLKKPQSLRQFKLWFRDTLPKLNLEGSLDGQEWLPLAQAAGLSGTSGDVYDKTIELQAAKPSRFLRVHFKARPAGKLLSLVEVEIWAADSSTTNP